MNLDKAHQIARQHGSNTIVYWIARAILQPAALVYFRLRRLGRDKIPADGPVILAANHRSFSDPFFIAMCIGRPLRFLAKVELFEKRWQARLLLALGAIPIKRGESDEQAMETARVVLEQGHALGIFPEGTRVRPGPLGEPRRGVGRLALETGAPIVPVAIVGTEDIRNGWQIRPRRVSVRCGAALRFPRPLEGVTARLANEVTSRVWSAVKLQWESLGGVVPVREVVVVGAGSWGTAVATLLARGGAGVQLVCRSTTQAAEIAESRVNERYLPGVKLPDRVTIVDAADIHWAGVDALCLAVPSRALPQALELVAPRLPSDVGAVVLTKGLIAPDGRLPSSYTLERLGARPLACLGGPAHAAEAVERGASLIVASPDRRFCEQLRSVFSAAGIESEASSDVVGVQLAGVAKNAAALAAGAAIGAGANAAGGAAGRIYAECHELARSYGANSDSFAGVAGAGDLVASVLATGGRNRRAGELLAQGVGRDQIETLLGQVPEAVDMVPALGAAARRAGLRVPAIEGLGDLVEGQIDPEQWLAGKRGCQARAA